MKAAHTMEELPSHLQTTVKKNQVRYAAIAEQNALALALRACADIITGHELHPHFLGHSGEFVGDTRVHNSQDRSIDLKFGDHCFEVVIINKPLGAQEVEGGDLGESGGCGGITRHDCLVIRKIVAREAAKQVCTAEVAA